jgi:hypothetical protein
MYTNQPMVSLVHGKIVHDGEAGSSEQALDLMNALG